MAEYSPNSTLSSRGPTKERVRVYQPHLLEDALLDSASLNATRSAHDTQGLASTQGMTQGSLLPEEGPEDDLAERIQSKRAQLQEELRAKDEAFRQATQRKKQEADAKKDAEFQQMYAEVLAGIDDCAGIMGESQETLDHRRKVVGEKQRALHQEWHTQVFDKIQARLAHALSTTSPRETEARLQAQMDDFLHSSNTKPGVFRDVIYEPDYDPLGTRRETLRITTGDLYDPLKRDFIKAKNERLNMGLSAEPSEQLGKQTFDTKMWSNKNVLSTPYGHCMDTSGAYVVNPLSDSVLENRKSKVTMDHYDFPNKDNGAAAAELGLRSGKAMPPGPGAPDTKDVLTHQCRLSPGVRKGDIWLEQKGKGHAPAPEAGRVDMMKVLHQLTPGDRGQHGGDEWLKPRGRAKPPAPQFKIGRSDLKEVIYQTTNPYQDGRALDDAWLQKSGKAAAAGPKSELGSFIFRHDHPPTPGAPRDIRQNMSCLKMEETLHPVKSGSKRFVDNYGS